MKKYLRALLGVLIASSMLCGCGALDNFTGGKAAKTTQEVIESYNNLENKDNAQMDITMDMFFGASAEGISMEIPMNIQATVEAFDSEHGHATMNMKASMFGQSEEATMEAYTVGDTAYTYDSDDGQWYVTDAKDLEISTIGISELPARYFEDATMEYNRKQKVYTVVQSYKDFNSAGTLSDIADTSGEMMDSLGMGGDMLQDVLDNAKVIYTFDKNFRLISMKTSGLEYSGPFESDGQKADLKFKIDLSVTYSKHGEIKESDVAVPESVKSSAVDTTSFFGLDDDWGEPDTDEDFNTPDDSFGGFDDDSHYTIDDPNDTSDNQLRTDLVYGEFKTMPDVYGSYNGINLTCEGDSWASTFGADGWEFTSQDNEYSFMMAANSKYDSEMYFYTEDYEWTESGYAGVTADMIKSKGIYGYSIDLSYSESDMKPNMTWNGVTFGASAQDLVSVYGKPDYYYNGTYYEMYSYSVELTDGHDMELEFYIYKDGQGLLEVSVQKY